MKEDRRPNPEDLLEAVQKIESSGKRGRLRIFMGMCPGVGKTYSMLKAAREQVQRGVRVSVGLVETHGRKETEELLPGLHIFPRLKIEYKGTTLTEMDVDAILRDRPSLVLVDELAHTNAPGSRHSKRYQDVEDLLRAGINVYSTINIQHIESRNDQVTQITSVQVRETVPDSFIETADQLELVDLSPEELLKRLAEGKVYLGDRAEAAIKGFFKEEHLTALRELALRFTAEKVDQDLHSQMTIKGIEGPWNTNERLLVAVSHSPYSARLIRETRRKAYSLEAPWVALYVNTGANLTKEDEKNLQDNLTLARTLGAEVVTVAGTDISEAIQRICAEKNVTQIVMGRPDRRFFRDILARGSLLDQLVRSTSKIDVHVIRAERKPRYTGFHLKWPGATSTWQSYYNTSWFLIAVSFFCYALLPYAGYRALGSVFLLAVLLVASVATRGPILYAAIVCSTVWNFFFIPPQFNFSINSWEDIMMVFTFFVVGIVGGLLTSRIRRQEVVLQNREQRTRLLYELAQSLADAKDAEEIQSVLASVVDRQFGGTCTVFLAGKSGKIDWSSGYGKNLNEKDLAVAQWAFENNRPAGWSTQTLSAASSLCIPMRGRQGVVGILSFVPMRSQKDFSAEKENFLETVLSQAAMAYERFRFSEAAENARVYEASEALHQTLLNSVSHELRTPITAIIGSSTALKDAATISDTKAREALTDELVRSAHRLDRVVENLLDLSRLQKGSLQLKKEWFDPADLFREVKEGLGEELGTRKLLLTQDDSVVIEGDFQLLLHSLNQLVTNAMKYSPDGTKIEIELLKDNYHARILVRDEGRGIPEGSEKQIFERFYRLPGTPAGGLGLGLTIVSSIVELHGGKVSARNRADGKGAIFEISLPLKPAPAALREAML
jgi:two-component system, OmpR family, sensor histidine kinase KdpD